MKVLLVADVGTNDEGFYHIGDEAMFYQTYLWYKKNHEDIVLGMLARSVSHKHLGLSEHLNLTYPSNKYNCLKYFIALIGKIVLIKLTAIDLLSKQESVFISAVRSYDVIHFTGGGNINSLSSTWLYYVFFLIFLGKINRSVVILTSQTIGPFQGLDRLMVPIFLNIPKIIALREPKKNNRLGSLFILFPQIYWMMDVAYYLKKESKYSLPKSKSLRIGLSLHQWEGYEKKVSNFVANLLNDISQDERLEIVLIPHVLMRDYSFWDMGYMHKMLLPKLDKKIKVISPNYEDIFTSSSVPEMSIKNLTAKVDLLISTRYHGVIFALAESTPCITFIMDDYYKNKNCSAFELVYGKYYQKYVVNLSNQKYSSISKLKSIIANISEERKKLKQLNQTIVSQPNQLFTLDDLDNLLFSI